MRAAELFPIQKAEPLKVRVSETHSDQFWVEGMSEGRSFDDRFVSFSGFFGGYGPDIFAAAPDLLDALKAALPYIDCTNKRGWEAMLAAKAAIAKAE